MVLDDLRENDRAVVSDLETLTRNSTRTLVADAVTAHGLS